MEYPEEKIKAIYDTSSSVPPILSWYSEEFFTGLQRYRKKAISLLNLTPDSIVLDAACGIGLNFGILEQHLKNEGKIIGVDISPKTIHLAKKQMEKQGWTNIELVNMSLMDYRPAFLFDAILCTQAMEIMPVASVDKIFSLRKPKGFFSMIGMKLSSQAPWRFANPFMEYFAKTGGIDIHRDVYKYIETKCEAVNYQNFLGGYYYILSIYKTCLKQ